MPEGQTITLNLRRQILQQDDRGRHLWRAVTDQKTLPAHEIVVVICDMWDRHWSRGAAERVNEMAPKVNQVIEAAREKGAHIIHAPASVIDHYADSTARQRMLATPRAQPPEPIEHDAPPPPVDVSDYGSDTGEKQWSEVWTRQHPAIRIDHEHDGITDDGRELYSYVRHHRVEQLLIMGVHTNLCVLGRPFGIQQMVRWGIEIALVRDLTDAMYNPARPPYVSHDEGTRLVVEYIEKFWCPTVSSEELSK